MSPLGWQTPHLVDKSDTQYLGEQHWQQCWCFRFFFVFLCPSVYLCVSQSILSVHLFRSNLKFLKTRNYWQAQLLHVSHVSRLELKTCRIHIKMVRNSSKKKTSWGMHYCQGLGQNTHFSNLTVTGIWKFHRWNFYCYPYWTS